MINSKFTILSFYQFKQIKDLLTIKSRISNFCKFNKIKGTIILAEEGINGTIAGTSQSIKNFQLEIKKIGFENFNPKYSYSKFMPFFRLKVRPKKEIVTLRTKMADPENITGNKIKPENWNNLITDNDTILIDVRNDFEVEMGSFQGSINPKTKSFTEFKSYLKACLLCVWTSRSLGKWRSDRQKSQNFGVRRSPAINSRGRCLDFACFVSFCLLLQLSRAMRGWNRARFTAWSLTGKNRRGDCRVLWRDTYRVKFDAQDRAHDARQALF